MQKRLMDRNAWNPNAFGSMNWNVPGKAPNTLENSAQIFVVKFPHDRIPACANTCLALDAPNPTNALLVSTLSKLTGMFSAAHGAHSGRKNCSMHWVTLSLPMTCSPILLSFCIKEF
jgi:hypothetical protein